MEMSPIDPQPHPNKNACRTGDHTASRGLLRRPSPTTCIVLLGYVECMYDCSLLCPCGAPHPHSSTPNLSVELSSSPSGCRDCSLRGLKAAMGLQSPSQPSLTYHLSVSSLLTCNYTHTKCTGEENLLCPTSHHPISRRAKRS